MKLPFPVYFKVYQYLMICLLAVILSIVLPILSTKVFAHPTIKNDFPAQSLSCYQFPLPASLAIAQIESDNITNFPLIRNNNFLESINLISGKVNWTFDAGGTISRRNLVNSEFTFLANTGKKKNSDIDSNNGAEDKLIVRSISNYSGLTVWQTEIDREFILTRAIKSQSDQLSLYDLKDNLLLHSNDCFFRVNKIDGQIIWKKCVEPPLANPNNINDRTNPDVNGFILDISGSILAFSDRKYIYILDMQTGEIISKTNTEVGITAIVSTGRSKIIYGTKRGFIRALDIDSKKSLWGVKVGGEISGIIKTDKGLLVSSFDNFIYMLDINKGHKIWKKRFAGRLAGKPSVNGNLAIIVGDIRNSYFLDLSDGKILRQISLIENESFLQTHGFINEYSFLSTDKRILVFRNGPC